MSAEGLFKVAEYAPWAKVIAVHLEPWIIVG
jgi:hypothetical protein